MNNRVFNFLWLYMIHQCIAGFFPMRISCPLVHKLLKNIVETTIVQIVWNGLLCNYLKPTSSWNIYCISPICHLYACPEATHSKKSKYKCHGYNFKCVTHLWQYLTSCWQFVSHIGILTCVTFMTFLWHYRIRWRQLICHLYANVHNWCLIFASCIWHLLVTEREEIQVPTETVMWLLWHNVGDLSHICRSSSQFTAKWIKDTLAFGSFT